MKLKLKPKPIFYCNGNAQKFDDDCLIANMTKEPLPKKWQEFFELTPEQKALWDAELRVDAAYRIAEAQGFPNGIPGGTTRGNIFYFQTQREEEYKRECREVQEEYARNHAKHFSLRRKTDILGKNKLVMEYNPYENMTNDVLADSSAMNEQIASQLSTMKNVSVGKIKPLHNIGVLNNAPNNTVAETASNIDAALPWWKNANQSSYKFSRNLLDGYGQNGGMNDHFFWKRTANSSMNHGGQKLQSKLRNVDRTGEILLSKEFFDDVEQSVYDVLQEFGGWQGVKSAVGDKIVTGLSFAGNFVSEWGEAYGETLLKKAPLPPNIKFAVVVGFLAIKVYDVARGVEDKRTALLDSLKGKVTPQQAQAIADDKVKGWLAEEIGKVVIEEGLDAVLNEIPLKYPRDITRKAIIAAWKRFIAEAETGRWERDITR